jgi:hypothetical protein
LLKRRSRELESFRGAVLVLPRIKAGIKVALPAHWSVSIGAPANGTILDVAIDDPPTFAMRIVVAAAAKGEHAFIDSAAGGGTQIIEA